MGDIPKKLWEISLKLKVSIFRPLQPEEITTFSPKTKNQKGKVS